MFGFFQVRIRQRIDAVEQIDAVLTALKRLPQAALAREADDLCHERMNIDSTFSGVERTLPVNHVLS